MLLLSYKMLLQKDYSNHTPIVYSLDNDVLYNN